MEQRFLRSKAKRNALWLAAGGKCQMCDCALPDDWHADHITPYSVAGETDIFDMQALCPACNLKKGKRMSLLEKLERAMQFCDRIEYFSDCLRKPQIQTLRFIRAIARGLSGAGFSGFVNPGYLISEIVPGGGKSFCAVMVSSVLVGSGFYDCAAWITPRRTLIGQAQDDFADTSIAQAVRGQRVAIFNPANLKPAEMPSDLGKLLKCQEKIFLVSYQKFQGMGNALTCLSELTSRKNVLLIFDEFQLMRDPGRREEEIDGGNGWWKPLEPIVNTCTRKTGFGAVILSGRLSRNDGLKLPLVPYRQGDQGAGEEPKRWYAMCDIRYTLAEAQADQAIIGIDFDRHDGDIGFRTKSDGVFTELQLEELNALGEKYYDDKLVHFLDDEDVWQTLIRNMLVSLDNYNPAHQGYRGTYMIIARNIVQAEKMYEWMTSQGRNPLLVHSMQKSKDQRLLQDFRQGRGTWDGLIVVGIGYIGLSVPSLCHMAYLTNFRSADWFNQALHRITRFDRNPNAPSYERQIARVFAPNDPKMIEMINEVMRDQNPGVVERMKEKTTRCFPPGGPGGNETGFEGYSASISSRLFNTNGQECKHHDFIQDILDEQPAFNAVPRRALDWLKDRMDKERQS